uniref:Uncharacterized protein n=2 Tax=Oryza sativa subsp. japonica TaxID=39947 RepID=Q10HH8_ORYSJ|nr:hypothetical protein [Oryza sativa Japonica Group]ABF97365.1 hypothetical protein LOC_Os03g39080 [Oryza sativa Japonica Group]
MEVKKPVGSRRRQLVLKMMTPISGGSDMAGREDDITSCRHTRQLVGEDVDAQQRRHNRPAVQAETPVGGSEGELRWPMWEQSRPSITMKTPVGGERRRSTVKAKMPTNGVIIDQPCRQRHQSVAAKANRLVKT